MDTKYPRNGLSELLLSHMNTSFTSGHPLNRSFSTSFHLTLSILVRYRWHLASYRKLQQFLFLCVFPFHRKHFIMSKRGKYFLKKSSKIIELNNYFGSSLPFICRWIDFDTIYVNIFCDLLWKIETLTKISNRHIIVHCIDMYNVLFEHGDQHSCSNKFKHLQIQCHTQTNSANSLFSKQNAKIYCNLQVVVVPPEENSAFHLVCQLVLLWTVLTIQVIIDHILFIFTKMISFIDLVNKSTNNHQVKPWLTLFSI